MNPPERDYAERVLFGIAGSGLLIGAGLLGLPLIGRLAMALFGVICLALVGAGERPSKW